MPITQPIHRSDVAGNVKKCIKEFEDGVRCELNNPDNDFAFEVEETGNYEQWKDYLTINEMRAAFKRAQKVSA